MKISTVQALSILEDSDTAKAWFEGRNPNDPDVRFVLDVTTEIKTLAHTVEISPWTIAEFIDKERNVSC